MQATAPASPRPGFAWEHAVGALGLVLFVVTLTLNLIALRVVQAYREKYD